MHDKNRDDADRLEIAYYTDPLCCWSWAFEPSWQQLKEELGQQVSTRYCMGGLIETWTTYNDPFNSVTKPIQMGPLWMQASHISGVPMASSIWVKDPPASSYLACIAVKCAFLQSLEIGEQYLHALRSALMHDGLNIAKQSSLLRVAEEFAEQEPAFDLARFSNDLVNGNGLGAFNADLQEVRGRNITRFPTLLISYGGRALLLTGYRKYEAVMESIRSLAPGIFEGTGSKV